jgi:hypothetical protein
MPAIDSRQRILLPRAPADEGAQHGQRRDPAALALAEAPNRPGDGPGSFRITRDGTWWHEGEPIRRHDLVKLFARILRRDADGGYALVTPVERAPVIVEDAPFLAEELDLRQDGTGRQVLAFRTNVDTWVEAGPERPLRVALAPDSETPSPYILVSEGLEARLVRSVFYELVDLAQYGRPDGAAGDAEVLGVWSRGRFFPLDPTGRA